MCHHLPVPGPILLTGATGFIGGALHDPLRRAGWSVRCLTRRLAEAKARWPDREWVTGDASDSIALTRALEGCPVVFYLVHGMGDPSPGWADRELVAADTFRKAAALARAERIVYLGGVAPSGRPSEHLGARLRTGELLRSGSVPCLELRAGMIVGAGSASWTIVRDLAARLPAMVLPAWLERLSEPVAVDDVVAALVAATRFPLSAGAVWDLSGPEALPGKEILRRVAAVMDLRPLLMRVPFVSPSLSSHWIRLVTRADYRLAAELVEGLTSDLVGTRPFWEAAGLPRPMPIEEAARRALAAERGTLALRSVAVEALAKVVTRRA